MKWEHFKDWLMQWAVAILSGLIIGLVAGNMVTAGSIVNDCKIMKSFRIGGNAYDCEAR